MLTDYPGTLILVSHDRDFLDRVASNVLVAEGEGRWQDYAGGYTDMVAQRGEGVRGRSVIEPIREAKTSNEAAAAAKAPSREKLSFKDKHALETLPKTIAALDGKKAKLRTILDDPGLYAKDPAAFGRHSEALAKVEAEMARAEDDWLALEMRREAVEG